MSNTSFNQLFSFIREDNGSLFRHLNHSVIAEATRWLPKLHRSIPSHVLYHTEAWNWLSDYDVGPKWALVIISFEVSPHRGHIWISRMNEKENFVINSLTSVPEWTSWISYCVFWVRMFGALIKRLRKDVE